MSEQDLKQTVAFLIQALQIDLQDQNIDIFQPTLLIECLKKLFPDSQSIWNQICSQFDDEERWNTVLQFIQINLLDNANLEFENLGLEEILEVYMIVAQFVEQKIQQEEQMKMKSKNKEVKKDKPKKQEKSKNKDNKKSNAAVNKSKQNKKIKAQSKPKQQKISSRQSKPKPSKQAQNKPKSKSKIKQTKLQDEILDGVKEIIGKPIHKQNPKTNVLMRDKKGTQAVDKAKRQFEYFVKDLQRERKLKRKFDPYLKNKVNNKNNQVDEHFLKVLAKKQRNVEQEVMNQQLKYFITLRDRKVAFINKIHRLTQQLQKERQIDWAHQQRQLMLQERQKVKKQIEKTQSLFDKNMQMLKKQYKQSKNTQQMQKFDQRVICRQMGKAVEKRKMQELDLMKVLWQQQNAKLNNIMGDEEKTKNKLIELYRKNRP